MLDALTPSRACPLLQSSSVFADLAYANKICGSGLAREGGQSGDIHLESVKPYKKPGRSRVFL
jgi:hypothetical protein